MKTLIEGADSLITKIVALADGAKIYRDAERRCKENEKSLNDLCAESKVSVATLWRIKNTGRIANLAPLIKFERTFRRWEKERVRH